MQMKGSTRSSVGFDVSNIASELLWAEVPDRYLLVRYEDFVASPPTVLRKIGQFVGENIDPSQIIDGEYVELGATHCAWGNPNRFEHGRIKLQLEDEWRSRMPRPQRVAVTAMTLPLLFHYKYPIRT